jgi:propionate CoA-transferase
MPSERAHLSQRINGLMKAISAAEAAGLLRDGSTLAVSGFGGFGHPEAITDAVERRFLAEIHPRDLNLLFAASNGDRKTRGMNHFAHEGLVRRVIAGGWRGTPRLGELAIKGRIEAYNWPQGVLCQLFRSIAARHPGVVTRTGLGTFVDPRVDGGRLNEASSRDLIRVVDIEGQEYLLYPAQRIDCAFIRGTTADGKGNVSLEHEAFPQEMLAIAEAARNSGGIVVVQVKRLVDAGDSNPQRIRIPGFLVDYVVVCESPDQHWMSFGEAYNPAYLGEGVAASSQTPGMRPLDANLIIQRRALLELARTPSAVINVGIGIPAGLPALAREQHYDDFTLTIESGVVGGVAAEELSFGAASHPEAVIEQAAMFDFYSGGGLDVSFLGMLQFDADGNVNVGRLQDQIFGVGGFIDIAQNAKVVCFLGSFTAGGLRVEAAEGRLRIAQEGRVRKLLPRVDQIAFNGELGTRRGQRVLYITERAVFELQANGLVLQETAPGADAQRDVLDLLPPGVAVADNLCLMDAGIFRAPFNAVAPA